MLEFVRRAMGRVVRWSIRPRRVRFGAQGRHVCIQEPYIISHPENLFLGNYVWIAGHCALNCAGGIRIGDNTIFGPFVHIYSSNHQYDDTNALPFGSKEYARPVDIGANVWLAGDVTVVPGVTIGEGAVVAAGAVVAKDIPPCAVAAGLPARVVKFRNREQYDRLKAEGRFHSATFGWPGTFSAEFVGGIPPQWIEEAGPPMTDIARLPEP
jgi:maltose O-acetyltransferase